MKKLLMFLVMVLLAQTASAADIAGLVPKIKSKYAALDSQIHDAVMEQQMVMQGMATSSKMMKKGKKMRVESTIPVEGMGQMKTTMIFDGENSWMIAPMQGKVRLPGVSKEMGSYGDWWDSLTESATLAEDEKVSGRDAYVILTSPSPEMPFPKLWVDKKQLLLLQAEGMDSGKTMRWTYLEFKNVEGWDIPQKTEFFENGMSTGTVTVTDVKVNTGLSDDLFDIDKVEAPAFDMQAMMQQAMQQTEEQ